MKLNWHKGVNRLIFVISVIVGVNVAGRLALVVSNSRRGDYFIEESFIMGLLVLIPVIWGILFWIKSGFTKPPKKDDS